MEGFLHLELPAAVAGAWRSRAAANSASILARWSGGIGGSSRSGGRSLTGRYRVRASVGIHGTGKADSRVELEQPVSVKMHSPSQADANVLIFR